MRALFKENIIEALVGLVVVLVAIGFITFSYGRTQAGSGDSGYMLTARFPNVAGVSAGTDVKVAGIKVGRVTKQSLDPASYEAIVEFGIDKALQLPIDSSAAITSEGLLGGIYVSLTPGGDSVMLKPGEEITETSGATDLMGLIGSVVNRSGDSAPPANTLAPANTPAPAAAPAR